MKEREFEILKKFLEYGELTLEYLVKNFLVSERTIRYSIEDINQFLDENEVKKIKNKKNKFYLEKTEYKKINQLLIDNIPMSIEEIVDYLILKVLFLNKINLTKECNILDISRSSIKLYLKLIKQELKINNLELKTTKEGLLLIGQEENIRRKGLRHIRAILRKHNFLPKISKEFFEKIMEEIQIEKIKSFIETTQKELNKIMSETSYYSILSYLIITEIRTKNNFLLETELEEKDFLFESYEYKVVKNNLQLFDMILTEYELYHLTDYFVGSYCCDSDKSVYKNWIVLEVKVKKFIDIINKKLEIDISNDEILLEWLIKDLKSIIYNINRNIKSEKIEIEVKDLNFEKLQKLITENIYIFNDLISREMIEEEIEIITYHIEASINRNKIKQKRTKNVLFVSKLGYGYTKLIAENLQNELDIKIIDICPLYRIEHYKKLEIDLIITNIDLKLEWKIPIIKLGNKLLEQDFKRLEEVGIEKKKNKIYISELLNVLDGTLILEPREELKRKLKKSLGNILIDDTYNHKISFENLLKKENILLHENFQTFEEIIKKGVQLLNKNRSVNLGYEQELLCMLKRYSSYLKISSDICFLYSKEKKDILKSDIVYIGLNKKIKLLKDDEIDKVFIVSAINEMDYLTIAEKILDLISENKLEFILNKKYIRG